jgi:hypothetical protein
VRSRDGEVEHHLDLGVVERLINAAGARAAARSGMISAQAATSRMGWRAQFLR